jgi:hypothetical protein
MQPGLPQPLLHFVLLPEFDALLMPARIYIEAITCLIKLIQRIASLIVTMEIQFDLATCSAKTQIRSDTSPY